jgi:hypothetical protein
VLVTIIFYDATRIQIIQMWMKFAGVFVAQLVNTLNEITNDVTLQNLDDDPDNNKYIRYNILKAKYLIFRYYFIYIR